jgi:thiamine-monophosphate kinase
MRSRRPALTQTGYKGELDLLRRIRSRASLRPYSGLVLGIGDDCALLRLKSGEDFAVTTDLSVAGRHFQIPWHPPHAIGHRTLARGLSDLAAMGARPLAAFLSLGLPRELTGKWLDSFFDGFFALATTHNVPLAGGDLAQSPIAVADIVLTGAVPRGKALLRSGARPGDLLYVTGNLGGASEGLAQLARFATAHRKSQSASPYPSNVPIPASLRETLAPHLFPQPRLTQAQWLMRSNLATASIDLSDGLSTDLTHLCEESGVAAQLDSVALPIHAAATLAQALHGGEDYELLFTASATTHIPRSIARVPVTRIGRILRSRTGNPQVTLLTENGPIPLRPRGWQHFS